MSAGVPQQPFTIPVPANETERLAALRRYKILDTPPEAAFDRITRVAARLFDIPTVIVSLLDESRAWFKSCVGFEATEVPRDNALCSFAVLSDDPLIIPDARLDDRFACNPLVQAEPGVRFYAGAPLLSHDGFNLGTLCLLDSQPRDPLTAEQQATLVDLAAMVVDELELRLAVRMTVQSEEKYRTLFESIDEGFCICEMLFDQHGKPNDYRFLEVNSAFEQLTGLEQATGKRMRELAPDHEAYWFEIYGRVITTGEPVRFENYASALNRWFDVNAFCIGEPLNNQFAILFTNITEAKHAEESRKQAELEIQKFVSLADNSAEFIGMCDLNFVPFYVNPAGQHLLGLDGMQQYIEASVSDFFFPEDQDFIVNEFLPRVLKEGQAEVEIRFRHFKTGAALWMIYNAFYIKGENNQPIGLATVSRNITDRKQIEATLQASEKQSRNVLESITDAFFALDEDWRFTYVNQTAYRLIDRIPGDLIGKDFWQEFSELHDSEFEQMHRRVMRDRVAEVLTAFYPDHDRWYEVRTYPAINGITIYFKNVTEQIKAEESVRLSESRFRLMVESAKDYAIFTLDLEGMVTSWNSGAERLLGYPEAEIIGRNGRIIFTPEDVEQGRDEREIQIALTEGRAENERWHVRQDGSRFWGSGLVMPLQDEAGATQGLVKIMQDKTSQKQIEAQREQILQQEQAAREEAERANRIKDEFLAVLSHELRSPLNPILGWARLLQNRSFTPARQQEALATIERNAKLQSQLIEDLLDISRIMQGKLTLTATPVSLSPVIAAAVETVRLAADAKNIQITLDLDPDIAPVSGDAARLQQVVWNLLTNAVKFTDRGGQVTVQLSRVSAEGMGTAMAQIQVIDTGKGISPQFLSHVFEYFRQEDGSTTRRFGGLGLGLAIVRQIVELHGGMVRAESRGEDQGATFIVQLPTLQASPITPEPTQAQATSETRLKNVKILLVDDDTDTCEFETFLLEQQGATVVAVASGAEALKALDQSLPDVIISDIGMAEIDGYALMQQIRLRPPAQGGTIRAIALTAYAAEIDQQKALQSGYQKHLTKPLEPEQLINAIFALLGM